jgi:hypothetical protein
MESAAVVKPGPRLSGEISVNLGASRADRASMTTQTTFTSRAVIRTIEAGNSAVCTWCGEPVKFKAKLRLLQVIANVYVDGAWNRVEHFHHTCYDDAGRPYGSAD